MENSNFSIAPLLFQQRQSKVLSSEDVNHLAEAFYYTTTSVEAFCQINLKMGPNDIENCRENRKIKLFYINLFHKWKEINGEKATLKEIETKMNEAELIATKQRFWNFYRDKNCRKNFDDKVEKLQDFVNKLASCAITEMEWTKLVTELTIQKYQHFYDEIKEKNPHDKILQRLNIIRCWIEKMGYTEGNITKLENALKAAKLRRVICEISGTKVNQNNTMNLLFSHFLEDEWDFIFSEISDRKKENILRDLKSDNIDQAFNRVILRGNEGFFSFVKALRKQCKDHAEMISFFDKEDHKRLFQLHQILPKVPDFLESQVYVNIKNELDSRKCLGIHGLPGSGKSQCASAYAVEFIKKYPLSIVWFLDCKNEESSDDSITSLRNSLLNANVCKSNKHQDEVTSIKDMAIDIKKSEMFVLLVLEDLFSKIKSSSRLYKFLQDMKPCNNKSKVFILATARDPKVLPDFKSKKICGFTTKEALEFLMPSGREISEEERKAAEEIVDRYSNLPLGIIPTRAFCTENQFCYTDYVKAMDEEIDAMSQIEEFQDTCICEYYNKNIFATVKLILSSFRTSTLSNRSIDLHDIFAYVMYFYHEKIPIQLFKQLIQQPNLLSNGHQPVSDILCKLTLTKLLRQLEQSSLAIVDRHEKDFYSSTVSTHRVVVSALKYTDKQRLKSNGTRESDPKLLNALHALTYYFQKDNRLKHQHQLLITLMPHVTSALSMVQPSKDRNITDPSLMVEAVLVIRLLELKGFACTQADAVSEAAEPLKDAYEQLLHLLFESEEITQSDFEEKVKNTTLEKDGTNGQIKAQAKLLTQFCQTAVIKIPPSVFSHLALTVCINQEDIDVLKRNNLGKELHKDIKVNHPLTVDALKWLREHKLAISEEDLKKTYLAELLASIAYTRGRLMFYDGFSGNKNEYSQYLKLSFAITSEVFKQTGVRLLHLLLSDTNGLLYQKLNDEPNRDSYENAYKTYEGYLNAEEKYYEHGVLKEDGKTDYHQMRCYKQMITANHRQMELPGSVRDESFFEVCRKLKRLVHDHPHYAKTAVTSLLVAGDFALSGEKNALAMEIYREAMDRLKNKEASEQRNFFRATKGYCNSSLKRFRVDHSEESRKGLKEAKQRCEKARVLVPRNEDEKELQELENEIEKSLNDTNTE